VKESGMGQMHVDEAIHERALERFFLDGG